MKQGPWTDVCARGNRALRPAPKDAAAFCGPPGQRRLRAAGHGPGRLLQRALPARARQRGRQVRPGDRTPDIAAFQAELGLDGAASTSVLPARVPTPALRRCLRLSASRLARPRAQHLNDASRWRPGPGWWWPWGLPRRPRRCGCASRSWRQRHPPRRSFRRLPRRPAPRCRYRQGVRGAGRIRPRAARRDARLQGGCGADPGGAEDRQDKLVVQGHLVTRRLRACAGARSGRLADAAVPERAVRRQLRSRPARPSRCRTRSGSSTPSSRLARKTSLVLVTEQPRDYSELSKEYDYIFPTAHRTARGRAGRRLDPQHAAAAGRHARLLEGRLRGPTARPRSAGGAALSHPLA